MNSNYFKYFKKTGFAIPYTLNMSSTSWTLNEQDLFDGICFVPDDKKKGKLITPFDILIRAVVKLKEWKMDISKYLKETLLNCS